MFLVCLFLAILFHEVQAICLSIAHREYQTLTRKASYRENLQRPHHFRSNVRKNFRWTGKQNPFRCFSFLKSYGNYARWWKRFLRCCEYYMRIKILLSLRWCCVTGSLKLMSGSVFKLMGNSVSKCRTGLSPGQWNENFVVLKTYGW